MHTILLCTCKPLTVTMGNIICDAEVVEHALLLVRTSVDFYSIQVFPSRIKDGELKIDISSMFRFLTQFFVV